MQFGADFDAVWGRKYNVDSLNKMKATVGGGGTTPPLTCGTVNLQNDAVGGWL